MRRNKLRVYAAVLAWAMFCFTVIKPIEANAAVKNNNTKKEEVVYSNLTHEGGVKDLHVVNILYPENGSAVDYGNYSSVRNMTTMDELVVDGDMISVDTDSSELYYEGTMEGTELPWDISISYMLDGKKTDPGELAGKSGHLAILLNVSENEEYNKDAKGGTSGDFYDNYAVQANVTLDGNKCRNIESENATFANVGSSKQLTFTMLPGKGGRNRIDADVEDFSMDGISINCVNMNLNIEIDKDSFRDDTDKLKDGAVDLDDGAKELKDTVDDKLVDAVHTFRDASDDLQEASDKIKDGTTDLKDGTGKLKNGVQDLSDGIYELYDGALELETGAKTLDSMGGQLTGGVDDLETNLGTLAQNASQAASNLYQANPSYASDPAYQALYAVATNLSTLYGALISQLQPNVELYVDSVGELADGSTSLRSGVQELMNGSYSLYDGAAELDDGAKEFDDKMGELQDGVDKLKDGVDDLSDGVGDLQDGVGELKDGTSELRDNTDDIDTTIDDKIDEMVDEVKGNGQAVSFTDKRNEGIRSVQFVIKTGKIEADQEDEVTEDEEEETGFWKKLLKLFGFIEAQAAEFDEYDYELNDCWWENEGSSVKAVWDRAEKTTGYNVTLYYAAINSKNAVDTITTKGGSHDFGREIAGKGPGIYYFRIYPKKLGKTAAIYSDAFTVDYSVYKSLADTYGQAKSTKNETSINKTKMNVPTGFYINADGVLKWKDVEGSRGYKIIIFADDMVEVYKNTGKNSYDISEYLYDDMDSVSIRLATLPKDEANYRKSSFYVIENLEDFAEKYQVKEGWVQDTDGYWYYYDENLKLVTGKLEEDGVVYELNDGSHAEIPKGAWIEQEYPE